MTRVAFYARVSTDRQQLLQTIEQQVAQLQAFAGTHPDWRGDEAHVFRDDGCSGAKLNRPGLDALRDHAARAAFDLVLVTAPDRLARNYVHQMVVLEELERHGCRVQFVDRPLSDDPHEQLVLQIRGAVAEYERTLIADRMRRGRQAKLRAGRLLPWARAPYGYRLDPERPRDPALVRVAEAEAAIVSELFAAYAPGGRSLYALAKQLTDRGVPSPTGKTYWSASTVRCILTNPVYVGVAASGRFRTIPATRRASALRPVGPGTTLRPQPRDAWITVEVPTIVDGACFEAVQRRLATNRQEAARSTTHEYLLRGLVSCGVCGRACIGRPSHGRDQRHWYCRCRGKLPGVVAHVADRCHARFAPAGDLDELIWADLCEVLQHPDRIAAALERARCGAWASGELQRRRATLQSANRSIERQRSRLLDAYLAGALDLPTFQQRDAALHERQEDLETQDREIAAQAGRLIDARAVAASMTAVVGRLRDGLERATFAQRRQLVELLIDRVVVNGSDVEIRYVIPTTDASTHVRFCHLRTDYFDPLAGALTQRAPGQHVVRLSTAVRRIVVCCTTWGSRGGRGWAARSTAS